MFFLDIDYCQELGPVISILKAVVKLFQFGIPILLIIFGMIDLGKAVIASKEDEMKKAQSTLIKRAIYAVAVFLVVFVVTLLMNVVADNAEDSGANDWKSCWKKV